MSKFPYCNIGTNSLKKSICIVPIVLSILFFNYIDKSFAGDVEFSKSKLSLLPTKQASDAKGLQNQSIASATEIEQFGNVTKETETVKNKKVDFDIIETESKKTNEDGNKRLIRRIKPTFDKIRNFPVNINDKVISVEKIECDNYSGDWVLYFEGTVTTIEDDVIYVKLEKRFSYRYAPEKEGIVNTTWWPLKRHSYTEVKFRDWKGIYEHNQIVTFPGNRVFNARIGLINGLLLILNEECSRELNE